MPATPSNPDFESTVRESFAPQSLMNLLGARLIRVVPGEVDVELPFRDDLGQQQGFIHAGVIASIADSACGYAAHSLMPAGSDVVSVEFKLNLLAPARGERFVARAQVVRAGRSITVCRADVLAIANGAETLVATMLATMMQRSPSGGHMPKERSNSGGPTRSRKDEPTPDRDHRHAASRDELKERAVHGARPGRGRRLGSRKK